MEMQATPQSEWRPTPDRTTALYLSSLAQGSSRRCTASRLRAAASIFKGMSVESWAEIRYQHIRAFLNIMGERQLSKRTIRAYLSAVRGIVKEHYLMGHIPQIEYERIVSVRPPRRNGSTSSGRHISDDEFAALLSHARRPRDRAILLLMRQTGLRRGEVANLKWSSYNAAEGLFRVKGKGGMWRTVYVSGKARQSIDTLSAPNDRSGHVFKCVTRQESPLSNGMTGANIRRIMEDIRTRAGVPYFSTHSFRHTMIGTLLDKGVDLVTVQQIAGHSSPTTTSKYDRRDERRKADAAKLIV